MRRFSKNIRNYTISKEQKCFGTITCFSSLSQSLCFNFLLSNITWNYLFFFECPLSVIHIPYHVQEMFSNKECTIYCLCSTELQTCIWVGIGRLVCITQGTAGERDITLASGSTDQSFTKIYLKKMFGLCHP